MNTVTNWLLRLVAGMLALVLLAACGGGGGDAGNEDDRAGTKSETASDSASDSAEAEPYLEVPAGVELTAAGTELKLRQPATVAWQPRQKAVAAARVSVRRIERTSFDAAFGGYRITDEMAAMTPYFVRAQVVNPTQANLGKVNVPLYLKDDAGTLVEATTLQGNFKPCPGGVLPKQFKKKNAKASICLVYLVAQGRNFENVTFQLPGGLDPVIWSGKVAKYQAPKKKGS